MHLQPLTGIRVVEWSLGLAAPFCGRLLADLGAEVIRIEVADGSDSEGNCFRFDEPPRESALFAYCNTGKRMLTLDMSKPDAIAIFRQLLARSDLLVHTQDRGKMTRLGLAPTMLARDAPQISSLAILPTADDRQNHLDDACLQFASGLAWHQARPVADPEATPPVACADVEAPLAAGVAAAAAAVSALLGRDTLHRGFHFEFAVLEFYSHLLVEGVADWNNGERDFQRKAQNSQSPEVAGGLIWILPTSDGWIIVSPREQHQWDRWVELMGPPAWASDAALCGDGAARRVNSMKLQQLMAEWSRQHQKSDVFHRAQAARVACFPLNTAEALLANDQLVVRGFFDRLDMGQGPELRVAGLPFKMTSNNGRKLARSRELLPPAPFKEMAETNERRGAAKDGAKRHSADGATR